MIKFTGLYRVYQATDEYCSLILVNEPLLFTALPGRAIDVEIRIGDAENHQNNQLCHKFDGQVPVTGGFAECSILGRYISVQRMAAYPNYLEICELKAFTSRSKTY